MKNNDNNAIKLRIAEAEYPFYPWQFNIGSLAGDWHDFPKMEFCWARKSTDQTFTKYSYNALENACIRFERLCAKLVELNYNAITIADVQHAISYDGLPYCDDLPQEVLGNLEIYNRLYKRIIPIAAEKYGLQVYFYTDEVVLPEAFKEAKGGRVKLDDPELWDLIEKRYDRLFEEFPEIAGVMVRLGELYETEGFCGIRVDQYKDSAWGKSGLCDITKEFVKQMQAIIIDKHNKTYLHRTWDLGFDKIHSNPDNQEAIFADIIRDDFYVLTKITVGDFNVDSPFNPVFGRYGNQIVEFQCKMEHDGLDLPLFMGDNFSEFLKKHAKDISGAWVWFHEGGHSRTMNFPFFSGFAKWVESNICCLSELLMNPDADPYELIKPWIIDEYGQGAVEAMTEIFKKSYSTISKMLRDEGGFEAYKAGADKGLDQYLLRWHTVFTEQLSIIYSRNKDRFEAMLNRKNEAVIELGEMLELFQGIKETVDNQHIADATENSLKDTLALAELLRDLWKTAFLVQAEMADNPVASQSLGESFDSFNKSFETYAKFYNTFDVGQLFIFQKEVEDWLNNKTRFKRIYEKSDDVFGYPQKNN